MLSAICKMVAHNFCKKKFHCHNVLAKLQYYCRHPIDSYPVTVPYTEGNEILHISLLGNTLQNSLANQLTREMSNKLLIK